MNTGQHGGIVQALYQGHQLGYLDGLQRAIIEARPYFGDHKDWQLFCDIVNRIWREIDAEMKAP